MALKGRGFKPGRKPKGVWGDFNRWGDPFRI